jgi:hypothetical protein
VVGRSATQEPSPFKPRLQQISSCDCSARGFCGAGTDCRWLPRASFTVSGIKAWVEELLATAADSSYEIAFARVQVAAPAQLTLRQAAGNPV